MQITHHTTILTSINNTMNYIQLLFSLMSTAIIIFGSLINALEDHLPVFFRQTFRYGKFAYVGSTSKLVLEVPKSTFRQFYKLAVVIFTLFFGLTTSVYIFGATVPQWFIDFLDLSCGQDRVAYTSATKTYVGIVLLTCQVYRRFYDTHYVSVFSTKSHINFSQYIIGMIYYPMVALAVICEAPKFAYAPLDFQTDTTIDFFSLSYLDIFAIVLFLWSWYHQHVTTVILANLRKDKQGSVMTENHKIPNGDWFQYLSCPHQTAEILMYFALSVLLWNNITWGFVFIWVLTNQVETILLSHWWYQETFDKFPKDRKALVPFLY